MVDLPMDLPLYLFGPHRRSNLLDGGSRTSMDITAQSNERHFQQSTKLRDDHT